VAAHAGNPDLACFILQLPAPKSGLLDPVETDHGLRDRASLSWRYEGPVREIDCSSPSTQEQPPSGQIFHAAGPSASGWTIMAVHDSKESWERFRDQVLAPKMKQGIEGGLVGPPQETAFEVHNLQK
jgi:hypothetical protein